MQFGLTCNSIASGTVYSRALYVPMYELLQHIYITLGCYRHVLHMLLINVTMNSSLIIHMDI